MTLDVSDYGLVINAGEWACLQPRGPGEGLGGSLAGGPAGGMLKPSFLGGIVV